MNPTETDPSVVDTATTTLEPSGEHRQQLADHIRREHQQGGSKKSKLWKALTVALALTACAAPLLLQSKSNTAEHEDVAIPKHATQEFGFVLALNTDDRAAEGTVPVVLYEDFLCPSCKALHDGTAELLLSQVAAGTISVEYRPFSFLTAASTDEYSQRAANAAVCVADAAGVPGFVEMHELLFARQPAEGGPGLPDQDLIAYAASAGASDAASCITERRFDAWIAQALEAAVTAGISSAPTAMVAGAPVWKNTNGKDSIPGPEELKGAIEQASS